MRKTFYISKNSPVKIMDFQKFPSYKHKKKYGAYNEKPAKLLKRPVKDRSALYGTEKYFYLIY